MPSVGIRITAENHLGRYREYMLLAQRRIEYAALRATDKSARRVKTRIRDEMAGSRLGRLGNALGSTSDMEKGTIKRTPDGGFRVSGVVFIRSGSKRTRGTIEAYTSGADIRPVRGRWLWFPSKEIQRIAGSGKNRERLTPGNWVKFGMDRKIGPLEVIRSVNGYPLMVVKNVGVSEAGKPRSARSLTKSGRPRRGQIAREMIVAFIGIPWTARGVRVKVDAIMRQAQAEIGDLFYDALREV